MNDKYFDMIDDYVSGECSAEEKKSFEEHICECKKCREEYELAMSIKTALSSMPKIEPPVDFLDKLNSRLDEELQRDKERKRHFSYIPMRRYSAVAACFVLVAVLGVDMVRLTDSRTDYTAVPSVTQTPEANSEAENAAEISSTELPTEVPAVQEDKIPQTAAAVNTAKRAAVPKVSKPTAVPTDNTPKQEVAQVQQTAVQTEKPIASVQNNAAPAENVQVSDNSGDMPKGVPSYMDPRKQVVLASSVEKDFEVSGVSLEDIPVKKRDLQAEFALLESNSNSKTGSIIATPATLASLDSIGVAELEDSRSKTDKYEDGRGSLFISSKDKEAVAALIEKYASNESDQYYYFTGDNFKSFTDELKENGISYQKRLISQDGSNVAFQVVFS